MGIRATVSSLLTAPFSTALEAKIREIAESILSGENYASPEAIRGLMSDLTHAQTGLKGLEAEIAALRQALQSLHESDAAPTPADELALRLSGLSARDNRIETRIDDISASLQMLNDELVSSKEVLTGAEARIAKAESLALEASGTASKAGEKTEEVSKAKAPAQKQAPAKKDAPAQTALPVGDRGCKVPGCDNKHRARGFCGKHYQMWRRNTLPGFVGHDGTLFFEEDGPRWQLDKDAAGKEARIVEGRITVDGKPMRAKLLEL